MGKTRFFWFVEPLDSHTNEVFARELIHLDCYCNVVDDKRNRHSVWECSLEMLEYFCRSRRDQNLRFNVFARPRYNRYVGPLRNCNFLFFRKRKQKKPAKALSSQATHFYPGCFFFVKRNDEYNVASSLASSPTFVKIEIEAKVRENQGGFYSRLFVSIKFSIFK